LGIPGIGEGTLGTFNPFSAQRFPDGGAQTILEQQLEVQRRTAEAVEWIKNNPAVMMVQ
jgi:hypothetical protein